MTFYVMSSCPFLVFEYVLKKYPVLENKKAENSSLATFLLLRKVSYRGEKRERGKSLNNS